MITYKNCKAYAVLAILLDMLGEDHKLTIRSYVNGREEGFYIVVYGLRSKAVAFSENRNSDNIVVYFGVSNDFTPQGNVPSEEVYKNAKYFDYNAYLEAAKFIYNYLCPESSDEEEENEPNHYRNYYKCSKCGSRWEGNSPYMNNDRCPHCNTEIEPYYSEEIEDAD
jgi:hypothetical protein